MASRSRPQRSPIRASGPKGLIDDLVGDLAAAAVNVRLGAAVTAGQASLRTVEERLDRSSDLDPTDAYSYRLERVDGDW